MKSLALILVALALVPLGAIQVAAETPDEYAPLFEQLEAATTEFDVFSAETQIREKWSAFDGATISLLMERGTIAFAQNEFDIAEGHFSDVAQLEPAYVHVWFQLASVRREANDYDQAARYLRKVVSLEPRHFDGWMMLADIMMEVDNKSGAYEAYKKALEVNPHLEVAKQAVRVLKSDVEGRGI